MITRGCLAWLFMAGIAAPALAGEGGTGRLVVRHSAFELRVGARILTSRDLVGATLDAGGPDSGQAIRIDSVTPAAENPGILLHAFSLPSPKPGQSELFCDSDAYGRRAGFPVAGRWNAKGRFVKDPAAWFPVCTSGAQGKCVLWGYDPWERGPHGEDLSPFYEACIRMVRADYGGRGVAFTRDGTTIDVWDTAGLQTADTAGDPAFAFEAGWSPTGAVCVAKTRYATLLPLTVLIESSPRLGGACDQAEARRRGALLFNRSKR